MNASKEVRDEEAIFNTVYSENYLPIYRYFYYKGVNKSEIEDLLQEVFLIFLRKYSTKKGLSARKIIYTISGNLYKEYVRKNRNDYSFNEEIDLSIEDVHDNGFEEKLIKQQKLLLKNIKKLNLNVRKVIELRFIKGLSRGEVAEKLNMSAKTVHKYQQRGIKYLKKMDV